MSFLDSILLIYVMLYRGVYFEKFVEKWGFYVLFFVGKGDTGKVGVVRRKCLIDIWIFI